MSCSYKLGIEIGSFCRNSLYVHFYTRDEVLPQQMVSVFLVFLNGMGEGIKISIPLNKNTMSEGVITCKRRIKVLCPLGAVLWCSF